MKKALLFIFVGSFFACSQQKEPLPVNFTSLQLSETNSDITVLLSTTDGRVLTESDPLVQNEEYLLKFESPSDIGLHIQASHGFTVVSSSVQESTLSKKREFKIKFSDLERRKIYVNIIPIHENNGKIYREYAQHFLLPN